MSDVNTFNQDGNCNIQLRDYQVKQKQFLISQSSNDRFHLFKQRCALESPTGSGKSIVMLDFVKEQLLKKRSNSFNPNIYISTGFNHLVWQIADIAKSIGLKTLILIGRNNCECALKTTVKNIDSVFIKDSCNKPNPSDCVGCSHKDCNSCYYDIVKEKIEQEGGFLVVTNHSSFIFNMSFFKNSFIGGFIDECQTYADFYKASLSVDISYSELLALSRTLNKCELSKNNISTSIFNNSIKNGTVTPHQLSNILKINVQSTNGNIIQLKEKFPSIYREIVKLENIIASKDKSSYYIHPQIEGGKHIGIKADKYFLSIPQDATNNSCIVSATVDSYTMKIFLIEASKKYVEKDFKTVDYSESSCIIYPYYSLNNIKSFISTQSNCFRGLFLSTRLDLVNELKEEKEVCGFEIVTDINKLSDNKKQILAGSKSLFQGIDIPSIDFVMINKIPFPRYDESYKKMMSFFSNNDLSPYSFYTIPYTANQLIQGMGRLWRKPGDKGVIAIFSKEALGKHAGILTLALAYRKGIKLSQSYN